MRNYYRIVIKSTEPLDLGVWMSKEEPEVIVEARWVDDEDYQQCEFPSKENYTISEIRTHSDTSQSGVYVIAIYRRTSN